MRNNEKKNKHMTLDDRVEIQECLNGGMTFKATGIRIGKSQTIVSREVKLHLTTHNNGFVKSDEICPKLLKGAFVCNGCKKEAAAGGSCMSPRMRRQITKLCSCRSADGNTAE